jgi:pilus assembly protein Flp/PilA
MGQCDAVSRPAPRSLTSLTSPHRTESTHLFNSFMSMLRNDEGATLVEYSLVVALIAIVCIGAVTALGGKVNNKLNNAANAL